MYYVLHTCTWAPSLPPSLLQPQLPQRLLQPPIALHAVPPAQPTPTGTRPTMTITSIVMVDAESLVVQDVIARVGGRLRAVPVAVAVAVAVPVVVATTATEEEFGILDIVLVAGLVLPAEDLEGRQTTVGSAPPVRAAGAGAGRPSLLLR